VLPEAISDEIVEFLDPDRQEDDHLVSESMASNTLGSMKSVISAGSFLMVPFMLGMALPVLFYAPARPIAFLSYILFLFGMSTLLLHMSIGQGTDAYHQMLDRGRVTMDDRGIHVRTPIASRLTLRTKRVVPYVDIRRARRSLSRHVGADEYEVITSDGHRFGVHQVVFRALAERPEFERRGFELVNTTPVPEDHTPTVSVHHVKVVLLLAILSVVGAMVHQVLFDAMLYDSEDPEEDPSDPSPFMGSMIVYLMIVVFALFGIQLALLGKVFIVGRLSTDFSVDESELRTPLARRPYRRVARSEVEGIEVVRHLWFKRISFLRVDTVRGTFYLPPSLADEIREHGYLLEDPHGLLEDLDDEASESGPMS
jgi:hypothetical protein